MKQQTLSLTLALVAVLGFLTSLAQSQSVASTAAAAAAAATTTTTTTAAANKGPKGIRGKQLYRQLQKNEDKNQDKNQDNNEDETPGNTVFDVASNTEGFATLVGLLEDAGLAEALSGDGPFTVFAPTDAAFAALDQTTLEAVQDDDDLLLTVLNYHVVPGQVFKSDLIDGASVGTLNGVSGANRLIFSNASADAGNAMLSRQGMGPSFMVNNANIITFDIIASNGVIHAIDEVLIPETTQQEEGPQEEEEKEEDEPEQEKDDNKGGQEEEKEDNKGGDKQGEEEDDPIVGLLTCIGETVTNDATALISPDLLGCGVDLIGGEVDLTSILDCIGQSIGCDTAGASAISAVGLTTGNSGPVTRTTLGQIFNGNVRHLQQGDEEPEQEEEDSTSDLFTCISDTVASDATALISPDLLGCGVDLIGGQVELSGILDCIGQAIGCDTAAAEDTTSQASTPGSTGPGTGPVLSQMFDGSA